MKIRPPLDSLTDGGKMKRFVIALFIYAFIILAGYAWWVTLENRALHDNLQELIDVISEMTDDALRD